MISVLRWRALGVCAYVLFVCALPNIVSAASINYGDYTGADFSFGNVTESRLGSLPMLFGVPVLSNNTIVFTPSSFGVLSKTGVPDLIDSQLSMIIQSNHGQGISSIKLSEYGDFSLMPNLSGGGLAKVSVVSPTWITILAIDGPSSSSFSPIRMEVYGLFTPSASGEMSLPAYAGVGQHWAGGFEFDVTGALRSAGIASGFATKAILTFDDTLAAQSQTDTIGFLMKKGTSIEIASQPVPEPSTLATCAMGLLVMGCVGWCRRKR